MNNEIFKNNVKDMFENAKKQEPPLVFETNKISTEHENLNKLISYYENIIEHYKMLNTTLLVCLTTKDGGVQCHKDTNTVGTMRKE